MVYSGFNPFILTFETGCKSQAPHHATSSRAACIQHMPFIINSLLLLLLARFARRKKALRDLQGCSV